MKDFRTVNANNTEMELNNRIEELEKIYKPLRGAYSLETVRDEKLVEDSAVYFDSIRDMFESCYDCRYTLNDNEELYVTTPFDCEYEYNMLWDMEQSDEVIECDWSWAYNSNLTEIANLIAKER